MILPDTKIPVSTRALLGRISRKLSREGEAIHAMSPHSRFYPVYGPYYVTDRQNSMTAWSITDLGKFAMEIGAMKPFERWKSK